MTMPLPSWARRPSLKQLPEFAGALLLVLAGGFWMITGRESVLVMMSAVMLIAVGALSAPTGHHLHEDDPE